MISFVVPAHNEEAVLDRTLEAIHDAARATGRLYEIIVVNDASTDNTAEIAQKHGAKVLFVNHRQIAATRNSGGRAAQGEQLIFVDADTVVNPRSVAAALRCMDNGAAGGGAPVYFEGELPLYAKLASMLSMIGPAVVGFTGGAFMFSTRESFQKTGGFDERVFFAEEATFAMKLKQQGRFKTIWPPVLTSGRRFNTFTPWQSAMFISRAIFSPRRTLTQRASVEKIWYDSNRAAHEKPSDSLAIRTSNGVLLVMLVLLVTGPLWNFIPWSATPRGTAFGNFRFLDAIFLCHMGLLVFWPCAALLFASLLRRRHWFEWLKLAALGTFCAWQAWDATSGAIWCWIQFGHWLAVIGHG